MRKIEAAWLLLALLPAAASSAAPATPWPLREPSPRTLLAADPQTRWAALAPAQRRELRARYAAWRALPASERQRVRMAADELAALPVADREALHVRFAGLDRLYRDGWRLGPRLGALYPTLQPLLGYLPQPQRAPMLALLHQLDPAQLAQLSLLSQRTPPQQRAALREELLALPAAMRDEWLQRKLGE